MAFDGGRRSSDERKGCGITHTTSTLPRLSTPAEDEQNRFGVPFLRSIGARQNTLALISFTLSRPQVRNPLLTTT